MSWLDEVQTLLAAEIGSESAEIACRTIERHWSGCRPYIGKRTPKPNPRLTPRQIEQQHGVSSSTAHRWACKWQRK